MGDITRIAELRTKDDGDWDAWPEPTLTVTSRVTGELRDRILAKLGRAGESCNVTLIETNVSGGYSEFTPETECEIEVQVDGVKAWGYDLGWSDESAMAEFMKWIEA